MWAEWNEVVDMCVDDAATMKFRENNKRMINRARRKYTQTQAKNWQQKQSEMKKNYSEGIFGTRTPKSQREIEWNN